MAEPIVNPEIPYNGELAGGLQPGKMIRIQGVTYPDSDRFNINLQTGPTAKPRDDTALHLSVRLNQGYIARNTYTDGSWGNEEGKGSLPIGNAQSFEIILLVDPSHYKIAVNGQHFCEFSHKIPIQQVSHLLIDGDVSITLISFEGIALPGNEISSQMSQVHATGPQGGPPMQYGPSQGGYGPPPPFGGPQGGYGPPPPPGAEPESGFSSFLEQAQGVLAGAIKSGAAEKLLGSIMSSGGGQQQQQQGYAPQNARYGIYPDLPKEDSTAQPQNPSAADTALSGLIAGSGGTITQGPQIQPNQPQNPQSGQLHQPGPVENLLMGLLSGNSQQRGDNPQIGGGNQPQSNQPDLISGLLSSLLSGNTQSGTQQAGSPIQPPPGGNQPQHGQGGSSELLSGILASLLSGNKEQTSGGPIQPQNQPTTNQQGGPDLLSSILSNFTSGSNEQQPPGRSNQYDTLYQANQPQQNQQGGSDGTGNNILSGLLTGNNQFGGTHQPQGEPQLASNQHTNTELLANLLSGLLAKSREQHGGEGGVTPQPPQNQSGQGGHQAPTQGDPQQYGQYPLPPQQEQRGPMESLLSGLLSGGGTQSQGPQPHVPQVGGQGSVGGLGSMGGILGSLAGSLMQGPRNDPNQRQHY